MDPRSDYSEALKHLGKSTTPEELSKSGVRRVRALKSHEILGLIQQAVESTLAQRDQSLTHAERAEVVANARRELSGLSDMHQLVSEVVDAIVAERRRGASLPPFRVEGEDEVRLLRGRLRRVDELFAEAEGKLQDVLRFLIGRPSGFREEQRDRTPLKEQLGADLFQANRALRDQIRRQDDAS